MGPACCGALSHIRPPHARATQALLSTRPRQDVYKTGDQIKAAGVSLLKEPGPLPGLGTKILSLTDPDGYKIVFVDTADFLKELEK